MIFHSFTSKRGTDTDEHRYRRGSSPTSLYSPFEMQGGATRIDHAITQESSSKSAQWQSEAGRPRSRVSLVFPTPPSVPWQGWSESDPMHTLVDKFTARVRRSGDGARECRGDVIEPRVPISEGHRREHLLKQQRTAHRNETSASSSTSDRRCCMAACGIATETISRDSTGRLPLSCRSSPAQVQQHHPLPQPPHRMPRHPR